jgi:predicted site-specific integrase-resolvase
MYLVVVVKGKEETEGSAMDKMWDLKDAASRVGVSPFTLRRWARLGRVASVRLSARAIRFRERDLEALVKSSVVPAKVNGR